MNKVRFIAIYLPQYHPINENDFAWGKGFTDWMNVKKAMPLYKGHYQPHIPHEDLGCYNLLDSGVIVKQAAMAKKYGIYGFAFYHYWFNGKRLLNQPLDNILTSGKPDLPFCYIWANENWTKRWDGEDNEIIIKQEYSFEDDLNHIQFLCDNVFPDRRYITINRKPVFIVYKPFLFPNIKRTIEIWRKEASKTSIKELYIVCMDNFLKGQKPDEAGFDATIHFQPDHRVFRNRLTENIFFGILNKLKLRKSPFLNNLIYDYYEYSKLALNYYSEINYKCFPGVMPGWDNSARRKTNALIFFDSTPEKYKIWLASILKAYNGFNSEENFVFLNAWNEWAEGNHLEPCIRWGYKYLQITKELSA
ncbi:MAG: glycoside hydrolase family 99-like domain-containing protein [Bacteroidales bacterium]|jgi:lipopolysaccharide biosynthesis protein